jgi:hypothetical protein
VAVMPAILVRRRAFRGLSQNTRITGCRIQRVWLRHVLQVGDYHLFVVLIGVGWWRLVGLGLWLWPPFVWLLLPYALSAVACLIGHYEQTSTPR